MFGHLTNGLFTSTSLNLSESSITDFARADKNGSHEHRFLIHLGVEEKLLNGLMQHHRQISGSSQLRNIKMSCQNWCLHTHLLLETKSFFWVHSFMFFLFLHKHGDSAHRHTHVHIHARLIVTNSCVLYIVVMIAFSSDWFVSQSVATRLPVRSINELQKRDE